MLTTFGFLTPTIVVILLIVTLIIFGPGKLPELGKGLGRGIKEFKGATEGKEKAEKQPAEHNDKKENS